MNLWRRVMIAVTWVCLLAAVPLAATAAAVAASSASPPPDPDLGTILLDSNEVPPGFVLDAASSGPSVVIPPLPGGLSWIAEAAHLRGYDRVRINRQERRGIMAIRAAPDPECAALGQAGVQDEDETSPSFRGVFVFHAVRVTATLIGRARYAVLQSGADLRTVASPLCRRLVVSDPVADPRPDSAG